MQYQNIYCILIVLQYAIFVIALYECVGNQSTFSTVFFLANNPMTIMTTLTKDSIRKA